MNHRLSASALILSVVLTQVHAQDPARNPNKGIAAIRAYEGTWKLHIDTLETAHSKAGHEDKVLRNDCWGSGSYYACNQYVDGDSKVLLVFTFDADRQAYTSYQIPLDGSPASAGRLEIQGNTWSYPWGGAEDGHPVYYRVVNVFKSQALIEYRKEFSVDKMTWVVLARGSEMKIK